MKLASDDFFPNSIFTLASAVYEFEQIDAEKGCDWDNSVHTIFFVLKLIPFVGNATYLGQKIWRLGSACCGDMGETIASTSQKALQDFPKIDNKPKDAFIEETLSLEIKTPNSLQIESLSYNSFQNLSQIVESTKNIFTEKTGSRESKPSDTLNPEQKRALEVLQTHPGVLIYDANKLDYSALKQLQKDYVCQPDTIFLCAKSIELENWQKGIKDSKWPSLNFIRVHENKFERLFSSVLINRKGEFELTVRKQFDMATENLGPFSSIEELFTALCQSVTYLEHDRLQAPFKKETLRQELDSIRIPKEMLEHSHFAGKFINFEDFQEIDDKKIGCFYYNMFDKCFIVNVNGYPAFTYENDKLESACAIEVKDFSFDEWLALVSEPLNSKQKRTLELLHNHPGVFISDMNIFDGVAVFAELKKNYIWEENAVFLGVSKSSLEDWKKGVINSHFKPVPKLVFIKIRDDQLIYSHFGITIDINGQLFSEENKNLGAHLSIEMLAIAHAKILEKPEDKLKAPIFKAVLRKEMDSVIIHKDILHHPCFTGKFLDREDFLENGRKLGDIFYSMAENSYMIKTASGYFTHENDKHVRAVLNNEIPVDEWVDVEQVDK